MTTVVDPGPGSAVLRPDALDGVAAEAWQSYNAMEMTKRRHYALLETLDLKRRDHGIEPSAEEARLLEWLLADHDAQVKRFSAASVALKGADAAAHAALFDYVGLVVRTDEGAGDGDRRSH